MKIKTHTKKRQILGRPLTEKEREAVIKVLSLPKEKRDFVFKSMENLFVAYGITDKDGKLISRKNLKAFQQMLADRQKL